MWFALVVSGWMNWFGCGFGDLVVVFSFGVSSVDCYDCVYVGNARWCFGFRICGVFVVCGFGFRAVVMLARGCLV